MSSTHAEGASSMTIEDVGEGFPSILFADPDAAPEEIEDQDCLRDLHLDQIISAATRGRDEYELQSFYRRPLRDPDQARYRQEVVEDLQRGPVRQVGDAFATQMQLMRRYRRAAEQTRHGLQRRRWVLESATVYCEATRTLAEDLARVEPRSAGLAGFARYLGRLVASDPFTTLARDAQEVRGAVSAVQYTINIKAAHVQVDVYEDEPELAPRVQETFARFAQHEPKQHRWRFKELPGLNHVEEQVLDRVARLFPEPFGRHYLAALGLPVPASRASLALPDRVFTHFEREESLETLRGKFEDELVRIHAILATATERSVLVMNESFGSTTLADGRQVGTEIIRQIIALGARCVFVSFIDEFASIGPEAVSMMSTVAPDDPAQRTFRIERKPADGLAYAAALAAKYRLGYDELRRRIGS